MNSSEACCSYAGHCLLGLGWTCHLFFVLPPSQMHSGLGVMCALQSKLCKALSYYTWPAS